VFRIRKSYIKHVFGKLGLGFAVLTLLAGGWGVSHPAVASGCFLLGCCGSPMLGVYLALFGAMALGAGKPLMAGITLLSTGCGYWCLSRRLAKGGCADNCCPDATCSPPRPGD